MVINLGLIKLAEKTVEALIGVTSCYGDSLGVANNIVEAIEQLDLGRVPVHCVEKSFVRTALACSWL